MRQISTETLIADVKDAAMQANFELGETEETKQHLDHDEILDVHEVLFEDALSMIQNNEIQDAKTISGLFMANLRMKD